MLAETILLIFPLIQSNFICCQNNMYVTHLLDNRVASNMQSKVIISEKPSLTLQALILSDLLC